MEHLDNCNDIVKSKPSVENEAGPIGLLYM